MITAIVLAAGESSRMNSPKALLKIGNEVFVQCIVRKLQECGLHSIYVIAGFHHEAIKKELRDVEVIYNERYQQGQLSSLKEGLRNLPTGSSEAIVWPVDQPLVTTGTVHLLVDAFRKSKKRITIPVYESRRGHPVIYDRHAIHSLLTLNTATQTAKDLQTIHEGEMQLVEVEDTAVLIDIDTPEDYRKYITDAGL